MNAFDDKYNEEIARIVSENPKAYFKMLTSKGFNGRYPDRTYLLDYIRRMTPCLDDADFEYSLKTRVYWVVNRIEGWDSPLVRCRVCGNPIKRWNVAKPSIGYKTTCCKKCERALASRTNKNTCLQKYGVTNVFASDDVRAELKSRKGEIYGRREENSVKAHGCKVWNNPEKAKATKIRRYGGVWRLEKCRESMVEKYGAPNPMQVSSIREKQQNPAYVLDGVKFDSSWEVYMYVWLRDNGVEFKYHPDAPEFWYAKADGSRHRYYPDFILTKSGEIWEPKGDNSFDEHGNPVKNGWFDWHEKYEYMKSLGVRFFMKNDIEPFRKYVERKYGPDFVRELAAQSPSGLNVCTAALSKSARDEIYAARRKAAAEMYERDGERAFQAFRAYEFPYKDITDEQAARELKRLSFEQTKDQTPSRLIKAFHKSMYGCRRRGMVSPFEYWESFKSRESFASGEWRKFYVNRFTYAETADANALREDGLLRPQTILDGFTITHKADCVSYLKPMLAKRLAGAYLAGAKEVFCPFNGFSGIMLGCAVGNKTRFVGRDVNETEIAESKALAEYVMSLGYGIDVDLAVADVFEGGGEYEALMCCPPYEDIEQWNFDPVGKCIDRNLTCEKWIDVCVERYRCGKYLFVVDDKTVGKYSGHVVEKLDNSSHFGSNSEYVVLLDGR